MDIIEIEDRAALDQDNKLNALFIQFKNLISELRKKRLADDVIVSVNNHIKSLNSSKATDNELKKLIKEKQTKILALAEKSSKIVPINYYRNLWLAVGMSAFGLPIGVAIGLLAKNFGLLAIGLPIGMGIGILVGTKMDKKAAAEDRQLDIEIKY